MKIICFQLVLIISTANVLSKYSKVSLVSQAAVGFEDHFPFSAANASCALQIVVIFVLYILIYFAEQQK